MPREPLALSLAVFLSMACNAGASPSGPAPVVTPSPPTRVPEPEPVPEEKKAAPEEPPEPDLCATQAQLLTSTPMRDAPLADLLARTELVGTGVVTVNKPDCSGVGHQHLALTMSQFSGEQIEVYRRSPLHGFGPDVKKYALVGAKRRSPRQVNLSGVCVSYDKRVGGGVEWVLPLSSLDEVHQWQQRLITGVCGRPGR